MASSFLNRSDLPLGLRNNNPGNIRATGDQWQGMIGSSGGFVTFQDVSYGIRAMATILSNDILAGKTLNQIISEYAPSTENNTAAYINYVATQTGFDPAQAIPATRNSLSRLIRAMMQMEIGASSSLVSDSDIDQGISMMNNDLLAYFVDSDYDPAGVIMTGATGPALLLIGTIIFFILNK